MKIIKGSKNSGKTNVMRDLVVARELKGLRVRIELAGVDQEDLLNRTGIEFGGTMGAAVEIDKNELSFEDIEKLLNNPNFSEMELIALDGYVKEEWLERIYEMELESNQEFIVQVETTDSEAYLEEYSPVA